MTPPTLAGSATPTRGPGSAGRVAGMQPRRAPDTTSDHTRHDATVHSPAASDVPHLLDELGAVTRLTADADGGELVLAVSPALHQPYGIVHGGVYAAVAERVATAAADAWLAGRGRARATALGTQFLKAVRDGVVVARAVPVHRGRGQQLWQVRLERTGDDGGDAVLVATAEVRLVNLPA